MSDWKQELVDFVNEKAKEHSIPKNRYGYFNLLAQLARHEAEHARIRMLNDECDSLISKALQQAHYDMMVNPHFREEQGAELREYTGKSQLVREFAERVGMPVVDLDTTNEEQGE